MNPKSWPSWRSRRGPTPMWILLALLLPWAASCSRRPLVLEEELRREHAVLAGDLAAASRDLSGDLEQDRRRLDLVPGREGNVLRLAGGWLVWVRGSGENREARDPLRLIWLGTGAASGRTLLLATGDSLVLLGSREDGSAGARGGQVLLLERYREHDALKRRLVQRGLDGSVGILGEGPADRLRWQGGAEPALIQAQNPKRPLFHETAGDWHLEESRDLMETSSGWRLGPARPLDSPYRCLWEFIAAVRKGQWGKARERVDLSRLLALPDGGWSTELKASLRAGSPELLNRRVGLVAPRQGALTRLTDLSGRHAWRLDFAQRAGQSGRTRWVLTRLERVVP